MNQPPLRPLPDGPLIDTAELGNAEDYPNDLTDAAQAELEHLWRDLHHARQFFGNGVWSMQCDNLAYRIVMLSRPVGALHSDKVQVDLVLDGLYERLHREAGIEHPPIDWDGIRETANYNAASAAEVLARR